MSRQIAQQGYFLKQKSYEGYFLMISGKVNFGISFQAMPKQSWQSPKGGISMLLFDIKRLCVYMFCHTKEVVMFYRPGGDLNVARRDDA